MTPRLLDKTVFLMGATGFMGGALARAFAAEGADLVISGRQADKLARLATTIEGSTSRSVVAVAGDILDDGHVANLVDAVPSAFGKVDVILCNVVPAVEGRWSGTILATPAETWEAMLRLIVWQPLSVLRGIVPEMLQTGRGSIIFMGTNDASRPTPGVDAYGVAKGCLETLTKYAAKEWGVNGIRVNCLCPGSILGPGESEDKRRQIAEENGVFGQMALQRIGRNDDVCGAAIFLASDESRFVSGQVLRVDGGRL